VIEPQTITIDGQQYWYTHYKEPFRPLPGALPGYPIGVPVVDEFGKLLCPYCKPARTFDNLGTHARRHGHSPRSLRADLGWLQSTPMRSAASRARGMAALTSEVKEAMTARMRAWQPESRILGTAKARTLSNGQGSPEADNKHGHCHDQIAKVAKELHRQGRLTMPQLVAQTVSQHAIRRHFGSMAAFKAEFGWDGLQHNGLTKAEAVSCLQDLAARLGHTPTTSELRLYGAPSAHLYRRLFGSLVEAQRAAGLDPNLPDLPADQRTAILVAYASNGSAALTGRIVGVGHQTVLNILNRFGFPGSSDPHRREWAAEMAKRLAGVAA
jgi:hypothetical protein